MEEERSVSQASPSWRLPKSRQEGLRFEGFFVNALDFNRATGTTPDRANWESVLGGINGMERSSRAVNRDFAISVAEARDHLHGLMTGDSEALRTAFPNWRAIEILPTVRR